jgi:hypothetical protein
MEGGFHTDLIAALIAVGGLAGLSGLAVYADPARQSRKTPTD